MVLLFIAVFTIEFYTEYSHQSFYKVFPDSFYKVLQG